MFDINNDKQRKDMQDYINVRIGSGYSSTIYSNYWDLCQKIMRAYKLQHDTNAPVWRSKLYFATFFLGIQALDAALSNTIRRDPIVQLDLEDGQYSEEAKEQAQIAHYDVNHDLYISKWRDTHNIISYYTRMFGVGVGREYIVSDVVEETVKRMMQDQYGITQQQMESLVSRKEHTKTDAVHPLNFLHDMTVSDFYLSRWASVRYPLYIGDLYKMLGDENYYQPGVKELIGKLTQSKTIPGWNSSKDTYYCENDQSEQYKNSVIIDEYSGDLNFEGNYDDNSLYFVLHNRQYNITIRAAKSPFARHPYWKEQCYPRPGHPYGTPPCINLLPVGLLKNHMINQYVDYTNANLKTMYEVYDGNIRGGLMSLITGQPNGFIIADSEEAFRSGQLVRPVQKNLSGVPGVSDLLNYIDRYEQQAGPSSNLRGKGNDQLNDTATGIGLMAEREDQTIQAMQDKIDAGISDCVQIKLQNRINFMTQPVIGQIQPNSPPMRYFPMELSGSRYFVKVNRISPDIQAGKYMSYLKAISQFLNPMGGGIVDFGGISKILRIVGRNMGIDEVDEIVKDPVPQINTQDMGGQVPNVGDIQGLPMQNEVANAQMVA